MYLTTEENEDKSYDVRECCDWELMDSASWSSGLHSVKSVHSSAGWTSGCITPSQSPSGESDDNRGMEILTCNLSEVAIRLCLGGGERRAPLQLVVDQANVNEGSERSGGALLEMPVKIQTNKDVQRAVQGAFCGVLPTPTTSKGDEATFDNSPGSSSGASEAGLSGASYLGASIEPLSSKKAIKTKAYSNQAPHTPSDEPTVHLDNETAFTALPEVVSDDASRLSELDTANASLFMNKLPEAHAEVGESPAVEASLLHARPRRAHQRGSHSRG